MKKVLVLLAMVLGATNMYAQDYDLQGLAKTLKQLRVFKSMPRWNPGIQDGNPVRVTMDMPLIFNFSEE